MIVWGHRVWFWSPFLDQIPRTDLQAFLVCSQGTTFLLELGMLSAISCSSEDLGAYSAASFSCFSPTVSPTLIHKEGSCEGPSGVFTGYWYVKKIQEDTGSQGAETPSV